jgi:hypothetical protein
MSVKVAKILFNVNMSLIYLLLFEIMKILLLGMLSKFKENEKFSSKCNIMQSNTNIH